MFELHVISMMAIFSDFLGDIPEVFMDDILVCGEDFDKDPRGIHQGTTCVELGEIPLHGTRGDNVSLMHSFLSL